MSSSSSTTGPPTPPREVAERFGVRLIRHGERRSLNAARNTGLREAARRPDRVRGRRRARPARLARRAGGGRRPPPRCGGVRRADPRRASRATPRAAAGVRTRRSRRSTLAPGRGGRDGVGRELRGAPLGGRAHRRVRREPRPLPRRRGGLAPAPARRRWPDRLPRRRRASTTGAAPATRGLRPLARAAYHRGRGARSSDLRRGGRPGSPASCACWPAAAGTPSAGPARRA